MSVVVKGQQQLPPGLAQFLSRVRPPPRGNESANGSEIVEVMDEHMLEDMLGIHIMKARRSTPTTFVGSMLLPSIAMCALIVMLLRIVAPPKYLALKNWAQSLLAHPMLQSIGQAIAKVRERFRLTADRITTILVSVYFLHEGFCAFQTKWVEVAESLVPVRTPFGFMRMVPNWQKGDAVDLVLLVTAFCTAINVLPEVGLILLLVDVVTDVIDMLAQLSILYLVKGHFEISELMAKKFSLLGVMMLVTLHQWRVQRKDDSSMTVGNATLLVGRMLMAALFFQAAFNELGRLYLSDENVDIDPDDPRNVVWPKVIELALAIPLVVGWQTKFASSLLAGILMLEAISVWQFWWISELPPRLHSREHFAVNTAVAGGLLFLQRTGGGRFTVEELLKKAS